MAAKNATKAKAGRGTAKKSAARRRPAERHFTFEQVPPPPPKKFDNGLTSIERLLRHAGGLSDEDAEDMLEAIRRSRQD